MPKRIVLRGDRSEIVPYTFQEVPLFASKGRLSNYENRTVLSHWHDDLEYIFPMNGHMHYRVNGVSYALDERHGIFVNSRQLHYGYSEDGTDCEYICVVIHPSLLCANPYIEGKFVAPIVENEALECVCLSTDVAWQRQTLSLLCRFYSCVAGRKEPDVLRALSLLFELWAEMSEHATAPDSSLSNSSRQLSTMKRMLIFVQDNYAKKIALSDIASAGGVSQSTCFQIFRNILNQTPVYYLTNFRLNRALGLLQKTDKSIAVIAKESGFAGASYFTAVFRERFGVTPGGYREMQRNPGADIV